jgi:hydrogenase/urease accessory protein HupE
MQTMFSRLAGILSGLLLASAASAHPGHAPTDVTAQVTQPFAGLDHFLAFVALTSALLVVLKMVLKWRQENRKNALQPVRRRRVSR